MKKKIVMMIMLLIGISSLSNAQKYLTKTGQVSFYSESPLENIEANNNNVNSALNVETGDFVFKVLIRSFEFEQALMQEHFNENYMDSEKYPNSTFVGKVINLDEVDLSSKGSYDVEVKGKLTIHGVTREVATNGTFVVGDDNIQATSVIEVAPADYDIKIPSAVIQNIAEIIEVRINVDLKKIEQVAAK